MQKGAILWKCVKTFVPHCLNAKLCYCTQVETCMTLILTEIKGINGIIMLLVVGVTLTYSRPNYWANLNYVMTTFLSIVGRENEKRTLKRELVFDSQRK